MLATIVATTSVAPEKETFADHDCFVPPAGVQHGCPNGTDVDSCRIVTRMFSSTPVMCPLTVTGEVTTDRRVLGAEGAPAPVQCGERVLRHVFGRLAVIDQQQGQAHHRQPLRAIDLLDAGISSRIRSARRSKVGHCCPHGAPHWVRVQLTAGLRSY